MDKNMDYNGFSPYEGMGFDSNYQEMYKDGFMNPMLQYEQGYMYYRYLTQQLEYKCKCKEYEKMCKNDSSSSSANRRVE